MMKRFFALAAATTLAALFALPAATQTPQKTVGAVPIKFPVPKDQCDVSAATKPGAVFSKFMTEGLAKDGATLLSIHTDCDQFQRFSTVGGNLTEYALYSASNISINNVYKSDFIQQACAAAESLKKQTGNDFAHGGVNVSNMTHMGALAQEKDVCYTGSVARVTTPSGIDTYALSITAYVLVKGKLINYALLVPLKNAESVADALARHKGYVASFIAANADKK